MTARFLIVTSGTPPSRLDSISVPPVEPRITVLAVRSAFPSTHGRGSVLSITPSRRHEITLAAHRSSPSSSRRESHHDPTHVIRRTREPDHPGHPPYQTIRRVGRGPCAGLTAALSYRPRQPARAGAASSSAAPATRGSVPPLRRVLSRHPSRGPALCDR